LEVQKPEEVAMNVRRLGQATLARVPQLIGVLGHGWG
jgi:hypothetical protein